MEHLKTRRAKNRGAAMITAVMFFVIVGVVLAVGFASPIVREYKLARDFDHSKGAYYLSEAGSEDAFYRIKNLKTIGSQEILSLNGNTATTTITAVSISQKVINSIGDIFTNTRRVKSSLTTSSGSMFTYGVQVGAGGVIMQGTSSITGNLYSVGPITGANNLISGTVIGGGSTGTNGSISGVYNQGGNSMYAGTIANSTISAGGKAYCNTISGSSTTTCQTLQPQLASPFPITDQQIAAWEAAAAAGGTVTCTNGMYIINTTMTIGNKKIPCDLAIQGAGSAPGPTVTVTGPLWVTGNVSIKNFVTVQIDQTYSGQSIPIIADATTTAANRLTTNTISIEDNVPVFQGAPGGNSWIMFISMNPAASQGAPNQAVQLENGATGDILLYAPYGDVLLKNNSNVKEVVSYMLTLQNNANVQYAVGLQNTLFTTGPMGSWYIQNWKEGQ